MAISATAKEVLNNKMGRVANSVQLGTLLDEAGTVMAGEIVLASGQMLVGGGSGAAAAQTMSGDATMSASGVVTIAGMAKLAGRASGQVLNGGVAASEVLSLRSTAHATKGYVQVDDGSGFIVDNTFGTVNQRTDYFSNAVISGVNNRGVMVFKNGTNNNGDVFSGVAVGDQPYAGFLTIHARGTYLAPSYVSTTTNQLLSYYSAYVWNGSVYSSAASITYRASEVHGSGALGTKMLFATIKNGQATGATRLEILGDGDIYLPQSGQHLKWTVDNQGDIGASGATRPRTAYLGTSLVSPLVSVPSNGFVTGVKGSAAASASVDYQLPPAAPVSNGQVLKSSTAGVMEWVPVGATVESGAMTQTNQSAANTDTDVTGASITLDAGTYLLGYSGTLTVSNGVSAQNVRGRVIVTDSANAYVAGTAQGILTPSLASGDAMDLPVSASVPLVVASTTTYKLRFICDKAPGGAAGEAFLTFRGDTDTGVFPGIEYDANLYAVRIA